VLGWVVTLALTVSACGVEAGDQADQLRGQDGDASGAEGLTSGTIGQDVPATTTVPRTVLAIEGSDGSQLNDVIGRAAEDLEAFWEVAYPEAYWNEPYLPLEGGLHAVDSSSDPAEVPCLGPTADISLVLDNAYYCPIDDAVVWDQETFMPRLAADYGTFAAATITAHEWGHVIQERAGFSLPSVIAELQADCFAGAWVRRVADGRSDRFEITPGELDAALAGVLSLRDAPGGEAEDPAAHGSGFDRVGAFQEGYEDGVSRCGEYQVGDPVPYQFPFLDNGEMVRGGELALTGPDGIVESSIESLDAYWTDTFAALSGGPQWDPLGDPVSFSPGSEPECNGEPVTDFVLFVCIPDRYLGFEIDETMPAAYDQNGDFAVATLFATQYGLDVVDQLNTADDEVSATLQGDCLAGAWSSALLPPAPLPEYVLVLSPGDLDEAVAVLLTFRSESDRERQGPGFDRVRAFRRGVVRGPESCTDL
jgi:predicted metalloprotease